MFYRKAITKIFLGLFIFFLILGNANFARAQAAQTPEQTATEFYKWYLSESNKQWNKDKLNPDKDPLRQKRKLLGYLSARLGKWIYSKAYSEYGADYIIDGQDFDEEWESSISVSKAVVRGNSATLTVTLGVFKNGRKYKGIGKHLLRLKMLKEDGLWKIDRINNN